MLGDVIKDKRKQKNLTLSELAKRIDVTTGYISQLERNRVEPSINVLRKLSDILDIPVSMLFSDNKIKVEAIVTRKGERNKIKYINLEEECEVLTPIAWRSTDKFEMEVLLLNIPSKSKISDKGMFHRTDECIYVLQGEIEYYYGSNSIKVSKGGSIYIPKMTGHYIYNNSDEESTVLWVVKI